LHRYVLCANSSRFDRFLRDRGATVNAPERAPLCRRRKGAMSEPKGTKLDLAQSGVTLAAQS
jgi:hypothetical protein